MSEFIAALPMYDWPEVRGETDSQWTAIRDGLRARGVDAPEALVRFNRDMPAVPGGIRDSSGLVIAPDPTSLDPDELDFHTLWVHPQLLFGQTCWGPMELGLQKHVKVIGQPDYSAYEGGQGELYSSAIVMRRGYSPSPSWSGSESNRSEAPRLPIDLFRGKRFAYNSDDSMSGIIALTRDLATSGETPEIFAERTISGGHRSSIVAIAEGKADVAAIDCQSWALAQRFEPAAKMVEVVGWTTLRKGLPYITALQSPAGVTAILSDVVRSHR